MTRKILLVVFFSMQAISSYGCESCGCSFSGLGLGMLTGFNRTYAGLSYQSSGFASAEGHNPTIHDQMQLLELSFRYRINSRWQVQAVLPYRHNRRTEPGFTGLKQGISDVSMMGFYRFINQKQLGKSTILSLDGGAGFQAPTGQYEYDLVHRQGLPDNFSLGYGAWAPVIQLNAVLTRGDNGLITTGQHIHYLSNPQHITFGAQTFIRSVAFHNMILSNGWVLTPFAGFQAEMQGWNYNEEGLKMTDTKGYAWSLPLGISIDLQPLVINASTTIPLEQQYANGTLEAKSKIQLQFLFAF